MNFSTLSINNPIPAIILFIILTLGGVLAFHSSIIQDFPDIDLPRISVNANLKGASPEQLETEVARKIENAVATLADIKHIYTTIEEGTVQVFIVFEVERNSTDALNDVRSAIARIRSNLPPDLNDPIVNKVSTAGVPVFILSAESNKLDEQEISWFVDNILAKKLLSIAGVGGVNRIGGVNREIRIELDATKMAALELTALQVSRQLKQVQQEASGGRGDINGAIQNVRTLAAVKSVDDLSKLELPIANDNKIKLSEIASISDTIADRESVALIDGKFVVATEIFRSTGASEIDVVEGVRAAIKDLQLEYPSIRINPIIDNTVSVQENFNGSMAMLYEGAFLAILVVWYFLRDWRATLIVCIALPLSILPAFLGMFYFGFTLNTVTLLALALIVGILVDDAIVEIENITRHLRMNKTPLQAATEAADEIGLAVIATTLALVAVFLPTAFMNGIPGKFFKQFGWTAVLAILASLIVARLLTPMMAAYLLKTHSSKNEVIQSSIMRWYIHSMQMCLKHRFLTILGVAFFFSGSIYLIRFLPTGFIPVADRSQTQITLELPPGSNLHETKALAEQTRVRVQSIPEVRSVYSSVGGEAAGDAFTPSGASDPRRATLILKLLHRSERKSTLQDIEDQIRLRLADLPGGKFQIGSNDTGVKMQIVLRSEDPFELKVVAQRAEQELRTLNGIGGVSSNASLVRPDVIVRPNFANAAELGITAGAIAETIRVATAGDYLNGLSKLNLSDRQVPIRVLLANTVRSDLNSLGQVMVPSKYSSVMLSTVADLTLESSPAQIKRLDRTRSITLEVELSSRSLGELYKEAMALPVFKHLPPSVKIVELGDAQEMKKLFASFSLAIGVGVLCIYGVLVILFKDFFQPLTILAALPLSTGGAFIALLFNHNALSMPSMIGLIMLMGVVVKNSILLVEYAIVARRAGLNRIDALVDACQKRSRPIFMTSIAMIAGMLPLALGFGADSSFRAPMAIAVIGGLVTSTLLSLLVVPAIYTFIDDAEVALVKFNRLIGNFGRRL